MFDTLWQDIFNYMLPRKSQILEKKTPSAEEYANRIHNNTAGDANIVLASGLVTNTTPATERWAVFDAPWQLKARNGGSPEAEKWFAEVSEITMSVIAGTNFYSEIHEFHLERNPGGTAMLYIEEGKDTPVVFKTIPLGTYTFALNEEGTLDTVMREFELTARQAVQKFGLANLGDKVKAAYESNTGKDKKFCFLHTVEPNEEREPGQYDGGNKPFKSCYDSLEDKMAVQEGGYDEMPYVISRFLLWPGEIWGYGPGIDALPIVRQVNEMEKNMDVLGETAAFPRILVPSNMYGTINYAPGTETPMDESAGQFGQPREWLTGGRYDIGKDRIEIKDKAIRKIFHNELFQMLGQMEPGRLTAYEVMQRVSEKLELFVPVFQRFTKECLEPALLRTFGILFRAGFYPEPPIEVLEPVGADVSGAPVYNLVKPKVSFQSKMALAIKALENRSFVEFMQIMEPIAQIKPEVLDAVNFDRAVPDIARNLGLPTRWETTEEEMQAIKQSRAQAQQMAQAAEMMESMSKSAANVGKAPPEMRSAMGM